MFHEGFPAGHHLCVNGIERRLGAKKQRFPVFAAPVHVGDNFRYGDFPEQFAFKGIDPDTARPGDPDIAVFVGLHAVWNALFQAVSDSCCERSPVFEASIRLNIEHADVGLIGIIHPHPPLAWGKSKAIGLGEHVAV